MRSANFDRFDMFFSSKMAIRVNYTHLPKNALMGDDSV